MVQGGELKITTPSERELAMTRVFAAPSRAVFEAWTRPELLKRWLLGPPGWTMAVCNVDLKVGGAYRFVWRRDADGTEMGMGGTYREIVPGERIASTEKFDQAWYPGEAVVTIAFVEEGGRTTATTTVRYASREARDIALNSDMRHGVAASYDRLEAVLEKTP
jgi:uncharacterized protein YndB with AHSA1/START domain